MKLLEDAGIHVLLVRTSQSRFKAFSLTVRFMLQTLATVKHCIHRNDPQGSYNSDTMTAFFRTLDAMDSFTNVLGVLIAEHLINNLDSERCAPTIRAVVRDLKNYMSLKQQICGQRPLPIGFGGGSYKYDRKVLDYMAADGGDSCVDFWTVCLCHQ